MIIDAAGEHLERPFDVNLWEVDTDTPGPKAITGPVDPADYGIDPLAYL